MFWLKLCLIVINNNKKCTVSISVSILLTLILTQIKNQELIIGCQQHVSPTPGFGRKSQCPFSKFVLSFKSCVKKVLVSIATKKSMIRYYPIIDVSIIFQDNGYIARKIVWIITNISISATNLSLKASLS